MVAPPSLAPKQETFVKLPMAAVNVAGCVILTEAVPIQPAASITVIVFIPELKLYTS